MQIRAYLETERPGKITTIAVNWREQDLSVSPNRLNRMVRKFHPDIKVIKGDFLTGQDFDNVRSIPAVYIFDRDGREVFRQGGGFGPDGLHYLRQNQLAKIIRELP